MKVDFEQLKDAVEQANFELERSESSLQYELFEQGPLTCLTLNDEQGEAFDAFRLLGEPVQALVAFALTFKREV